MNIERETILSFGIGINNAGTPGDGGHNTFDTIHNILKFDSSYFDISKLSPRRTDRSDRS